jgi:hypothetical protein
MTIVGNAEGMHELAEHRSADEEPRGEVGKDHQPENDVQVLDRPIAEEEGRDDHEEDGDQIEGEQTVAKADRAPARAVIELSDGIPPKLPASAHRLRRVPG